MTIYVVFLVLLLSVTTNCFTVPQAKGNAVQDLTRLNDAKETKENIDYQTRIDECNQILKKAAETREEDPDLVYEALEDLEKLMRVKCSSEPEFANEILENLNGSWRLIFTTGTKSTQKKLKGGRINYFPIKAVQSFSSKTTPFYISNGIYLIGDRPVLQFSGDFDFNLKLRKLEFDFDEISILGFKISLGKGQAAQIGASSGLGAESNVERAKRDKKALFQWISADENIATARGGGGGLALWKRIPTVEE